MSKFADPHVVTRLSSGKRWLLAVLGLATIAVIVSHELIASPMLIKSAISDGVDGFGCRELRVEGPSGSWNRHSHIMRAALRMPKSCLTDLRQRVEGSARFRAERCNLIEPCWVRVDDDATYTFTFHPDRADFRFETR